MAQGRSTKIISMIKSLRTSRFSIKNSFSLNRRQSHPCTCGCGHAEDLLGVLNKPPKRKLKRRRNPSPESGKSDSILEPRFDSQISFLNPQSLQGVEVVHAHADAVARGGPAGGAQQTPIHSIRTLNAQSQTPNQKLVRSRNPTAESCPF